MDPARSAAFLAGAAQPPGSVVDVGGVLYVPVRLLADAFPASCRQTYKRLADQAVLDGMDEAEAEQAALVEIARDILKVGMRRDAPGPT